MELGSWQREQTSCVDSSKFCVPSESIPSAPVFETSSVAEFILNKNLDCSAFIFACIEGLVSFDKMQFISIQDHISLGQKIILNSEKTIQLGSALVGIILILNL